MKLIPGTDIYVPDAEAHFTGTTKQGKPVWENYQRDRLEAAYPHVAYWDVAADVGAHVGLLTRELATRFREVHAFEPSAETYECLAANTRHLPNVVLHNCALGEQSGIVGVEPTGDNSGDRQIVPDGTGVELRTLDSFQLSGCGLLKIDTQGYEYPVVRGARGTIRAFSPVVVLEEEPRGKLRQQFYKPGLASAELEGDGAAAVATLGADRVMAFGPNGAWPYTKYERKGDYHWLQYEGGKVVEMVDRVVGYINAQQFGRFLDVGCGDGLYTAKIDNAIGIDSNSHAVKLARRRYVRANHLSAYRAHELGQFAAVGLFDVLEHLTRPDLVLARLRSVTGNLLILNPTPSATPTPWHVREFTTDELVAFAATFGWQLRHVLDVALKARRDTAKSLLHFTGDLA